MPDEYVHVGAHAHILSSGRPIGPGDRVTHDELVDEAGHVNSEDQVLLDEEHLVDVESFTGPSNEPVGTGSTVYERARELDIPGRSKMTADELRQAVADAETQQSSEES